MFVFEHLGQTGSTAAAQVPAIKAFPRISFDPVSQSGLLSSNHSGSM
jgi:hypothetical protein